MTADDFIERLPRDPGACGSYRAYPLALLSRPGALIGHPSSLLEIFNFTVFRWTLHIDEVDDDDSAEVSKANLSSDHLGSLVRTATRSAL